mgnify:CR=1 FL=1
MKCGTCVVEPPEFPLVQLRVKPEAHLKKIGGVQGIIVSISSASGEAGSSRYSGTAAKQPATDVSISSASGEAGSLKQAKENKKR